MRIGYIVPRCVPTNSHGRYVIELAKAFGPRHEVHVVSGSFSEIPLPFATRRLRLPNRPTIARLGAWWMAAPFVLRRERFDVIHTIGADAPIGTVVTAPCCNRGIRLALARAAETSYSGSRSTWLTRSMSRIAESADRYCVRHATVRRVIAPSRRVATELETLYGLAPEKVTLVPWGVDLNAFSPQAREARRAAARAGFGFTERDTVLVYVGGAYWLKGLRGLLQALRSVSDPGIRLLLAGVAPNDELLVEERRGLTGRLVLAGHVADVLDAYAAADAFVLPTLYDGFSLATVEAMACGLPVIVSRHAGIAERLTPGDDSIVLERPTDAGEIERAIRELANNPELRGRLGARARETAAGCSWKEVAERVMAVYEAAVA